MQYALNFPAFCTYTAFKNNILFDICYYGSTTIIIIAIFNLCNFCWGNSVAHRFLGISVCEDLVGLGSGRLFSAPSQSKDVG